MTEEIVISADRGDHRLFTYRRDQCRQISRYRRVVRAASIVDDLRDFVFKDLVKFLLFFESIGECQLARDLSSL